MLYKTYYQIIVYVFVNILYICPMVRKKLVCSEAKEAANKLKTIRKRLHVTQKSLEESTGIEQAVLSRIEKGTSEPQISTLVNIADALGYDLIIKFVKKKTK